MPDVTAITEMLNESCPHGLRATGSTELRELCGYPDGGSLHALTFIAVGVRASPWGWPLHCTVVWRSDVDGVRQQCTILSDGGIVLSTWDGTAT